jgi:phospholipid/cholesterol/gamma-HCH transport system ATP-binding protein
LSSIRFDAVTKAFGDEPVLDRLTLHVEPGHLKVILGGSGSGKSTLLKLVLGLVRPDSGQVFVGDHEVSAMSEEELMPIRGEIGMVFQAGALFDSLSVADNVAYRLRERGDLDEAEIEARVRRMLGFVGLESAYDKMPSELSGGMRRRVAIARALVGKPKTMLYDEPTAGLDPITGRTICELVMTLRDLEGVTSLFVTHDLNSARTMATERVRKNGDGKLEFIPVSDLDELGTEIVILEKGRIVFEGNQEELDAANDAYIREFLD